MVGFKIKVSDQVIYKTYTRKGKLDHIWRLYNRVVKEIVLVTFKVWDQLRNKVKREYANNLKRAAIGEWVIPKLIEKWRPIQGGTIKLSP